MDRLRAFARTILVYAGLALLVGGLTSLAAKMLAQPREASIFLEEDAQRYLRSVEFPTLPAWQRFETQLIDLAGEHKVSVYITLLERPQNGQSVSAALRQRIEAARARIAELAATNRNLETDALILVLMRTPRSFALAGAGRVQTRLMLRHSSSRHNLRHWQLRHAQARDGRYLLHSLELVSPDLRPVGFFVENHPLAGWFPDVLDQVLPGVALPDGLSAKVMALVAPLSTWLAGGNIYLFAGLLAGLSLIVNQFTRRLGRLAANRVPRGSKLLAGVIQSAILLPVLGVVAVITYGNLEDVASLSQVSGQNFTDLVRFARTLNAEPFELPQLVVIAAAVLITIGFHCFVQEVIADLLYGPSADDVQGLATREVHAGVSPVIAVPLIGIALSLPMAVFVSLCSFEGGMGALVLAAALPDAIERIARVLSGPSAKPAAPVPRTRSSRPRS